MSGRWPSNFLIIHNPGCERVGTKRVKTHWSQPTHGAVEKGMLYELGYAGKDNRIGEKVGYADPDGLEIIDDWRCTENCPVAKLGRQGIAAGVHGAGKARGAKREANGTGMFSLPGDGHRIGDKGTAARFFFQADWSYERIEAEELWNG